MKTFRIAVLAGLWMASMQIPASATLMLIAGSGSPSIATNNFGSTGTYFVGGVNTPHPTPGPVSFLYVFNADGTTSTYYDSAVGLYDNAEDTQVGALNNSLVPVSSFNLSSTTLQIFGFDGDGINQYLSRPFNLNDTTGYGGPQTFFTNINPGKTSGTANFIGDLAPGSSTFFSLEEPLPIGGVIVTPPVNAVPEPSSVAMVAIAGVSLLGYKWRRGRTAA